MPVPFGNIKAEDFLDIFHRMRRAFPSPPKRQYPATVAKFESMRKNGTRKYNKFQIQPNRPSISCFAVV
jgi:hypothetical protein